MHAFDVLPLGDSALLLRPTREVDFDSLLNRREQLAAARIDGVKEVVIAYESLAVFVEPMAGEAVERAVTNLLASPPEPRMDTPPPRLIEIPVCYDAKFAPDIDDVAKHNGITAEEVVRLHSGALYRVRCVGFTPGFPYLSGLPAALVTPRRATPRTNVPAGSVAIGGTQTGIYPTNSPGGWHVIGRTPLQLFSPNAQPPALLQPGDQVRFRAIRRAAET